MIAFPLLLVVGSLAYKAWAFGIAEIPLDRFTVYFGLAAKLDEFGLGMLLAVAFAARGHDRPWPRAVALAVRLTALGVAVLAFSTRGLGGWYAVMFHSVVSVAALLLLAGTLRAPRRSTWVRFASLRPLTVLGLWSYSLYLWHEPLMFTLSARLPFVVPGEQGFLALTAVLVPASLLVAWISYVVIEGSTAVLATPIDRDARYAPLPPSDATRDPARR